VGGERSPCSGGDPAHVRTGAVHIRPRGRVTELWVAPPRSSRGVYLWCLEFEGPFLVKYGRKAGALAASRPDCGPSIAIGIVVVTEGRTDSLRWIDCRRDCL
jgi:hypothetical protein